MQTNNEQKINLEPTNSTKEKGISKTSIGSGEKLYEDLCASVNRNEYETNSQTSSQEEWEKPIAFDKYPIPSFPINIFNDPIKKMIENTSEALQTQLDLPATIALAVLSTCLSKKFKVEPKKNWSEPVNLYIVSLLDSSSRKSPTFNAMVEPIQKHQIEIKNKMQLIVENRSAERTALENRIEFLQKRYGKDEDQKHLDDIKILNKKLAEIPNLYLPDLILDDLTPEALVSNLYKNNGKTAILSSEGDLFEKFKSKFTDVKYDVFLKSYSEDYIRTDRISRDTEEIAKPNLTICITAQPSVVKNLPSSILDRGLLARFIYSVPIDNLGGRSPRTGDIPEEINKDYISFIQKLLTWDSKETIPLKLSDEALNLLFCTMDEIEAEFLEGGIFHDEMRAWGGKLIGQLVRISGLLHVSYQATKVQNIEEIERTISYETLENALKLKGYLIAHAQKAFGVMKQSRNFDDAEYVLEKILKQNSPIVDKYTIKENTNKKIKGKERLQRAYDLLEYYSYIKQVVGGASGRKGQLLVNPYLRTNNTENDLNYPSLKKL